MSFIIQNISNCPSLASLGDDFDLIWAGSICMWMEYLCQRGQVQQVSGDVSELKVGQVETKMQKWMPMFFFAQGNAEKFYALLPHDSYRMQAYEFLTNWKKWYFDETIGEVRFGTSSARVNVGTGDVEYLSSGSTPPAE